MAGLRVGQAYGVFHPHGVWAVGTSPQILGHPTSICDTGVNGHFLLELISLLVNLCLTAFKWPFHVFCSFCSLESLALSVKKILSRWAAVHGAANNEFIEPKVRILEGSNSRMNDRADTAPRVCFTKCCCRKLCKGNRGLKMHQRSCRVVLGLNDQLHADLNHMLLTDQEYGSGSVPLITSGGSSLEPGDYGFPDIERGINLPKSDDRWITANECFKSVLFLNPQSRLKIATQVSNF